MSSMPLGGRSLHYAEQISSQFIPYGAGNWAVYADREATLSEDLRLIDSRRLRYLRVTWNSGEFTMSRDHAIWLRDALTSALEAVDGDVEVER